MVGSDVLELRVSDGGVAWVEYNLTVRHHEIVGAEIWMVCGEVFDTRLYHRRVFRVDYPIVIDDDCVVLVELVEVDAIFKLAVVDRVVFEPIKADTVFEIAVVNRFIPEIFRGVVHGLLYESLCSGLGDTDGAISVDDVIRPRSGCTCGSVFSASCRCR